MDSRVKVEAAHSDDDLYGQGGEWGKEVETKSGRAWRMYIASGSAV